MTRRGFWVSNARPWGRAGSFLCYRGSHPLFHVRSTEFNLRLKVLKDEIRKPYFLKLKEYLWEQGVKGAQDSAKSLKVYPARESPRHTSCQVPASPNRLSSTKHILMVEPHATGSRQSCHYWSRPVSWPEASSWYASSSTYPPMQCSLCPL